VEQESILFIPCPNFPTLGTINLTFQSLQIYSCPLIKSELKEQVLIDFSVPISYEYNFKITRYGLLSPEITPLENPPPR